MMQRNEWKDSDPSFVQVGTKGLPGWAARIGWTRRKLQDAVESGLVQAGEQDRARSVKSTDGAAGKKARD